MLCYNIIKCLRKGERMGSNCATQNKKAEKKSFDFIDTLKKGIKSGLNTTFILAKIMVPVYFFVTILKHTPLINYISQLFTPLMQIVGLPGEAAIVLVLGNLINLYAAVGAVASLSLTPKEITIIAVMLSFSHSLFMETAVAKKTGISVLVVLIIRFSLAILSGIILNFVL